MISWRDWSFVIEDEIFYLLQVLQLFPNLDEVMLLEEACHYASSTQYNTPSSFFYVQPSQRENNITKYGRQVNPRKWATDFL